MAKTIKYSGIVQNWPELSITGKPSKWLIGQQEEREDAEADLLLATRLFTEIINANRVNGGAKISGVIAQGKTIIASLPYGYTGNLQLVRTLTVSPFTETNIGAAGTGVNSISYIVQAADVTNARVDLKVSAVTQITLGAVGVLGAPGAPTIGTITAGNGKVTVNWTLPTDNGGSALLEQEVALTNGVTVKAGAAATSIDVTTNNGRAVGASVRARNAVDWGPFSAWSNVVTPLSVDQPPVISALNSATLFGDSLMQYGNPLVTGSAPASGGGTSMSHVGWANDTLRLTGAGIDPIALRAVGGTTIQQHLSTQLPAVLADSSVGAWYKGGPNSFNDAISTPLGGPYTLAQNIAAATSIITQLAAAKQWVIIDNISPVSQAGTTGAKARASEFPAYNAGIKAVCDALPNVIYNDDYAALVDPASGVFNPLPNLIQATDGIHDTTQGARVRGEHVAPTIASRLALTKYRTAGANLLPVFTGTGGTATPGTGTINGIAALPANWNCTIASGTSTVTLSNPAAGTVRLTISNPGGAASTVQLFALNAAELLAAIGSGDVVQGGADYATVGTSTNLTRIAASIRINGAAGTIWNAMARDTTNEAAGVFKYNQAPSAGRRWFHPWTIPSAPSQVEFILAINVDPAGSAVVDFSLPTLFKLAA